MKTCPSSGCSQVTTLASGIPLPVGLASDAEYVYWSATLLQQDPNHSGVILKCAISGCPGGPTTVIGGLDIPGAVAVDDTHVYWVDQGGDNVGKAPK